MRQVALLFISGLLTITSFAQDKKDLAVSFSAGIFTSPYYYDTKAREYYSVDFDYHITARHILSASFNSGKHSYNDSISSVLPVTENTWNTRASYLTFSILYKYKFLNTEKISANIGAGAGIMTHIRQYLWSPTYGDGSQSVWTDLTFPVRLDLDYKVSKLLRIGIIGGLFIHPDYPVLGYHVGPRLSYVIK